MGFAVDAAGVGREATEARWTVGCASGARLCLQATGAQTASAARRSGVERRKDSVITVEQQTITAPGFPPGEQERKAYTVACTCPPDEGPEASLPAFRPRRQLPSDRGAGYACPPRTPRGAAAGDPRAHRRPAPAPSALPYRRARLRLPARPKA